MSRFLDLCHGRESPQGPDEELVHLNLGQLQFIVADNTVVVREVVLLGQHRDGRFRSDLYYRVAQLALRIPPLRERPADVEWLAEDLLKACAPSRRFTASARAALLGHEWPGNVRELKNTIERAVALSGSTGALGAAELMLRSSASASVSASASTTAARSSSRLVFSDAVRSLARRAISDDAMPKPDGHAAKRARAEQRAAFLSLRLEEPHTTWSPNLTRQFQRVFGKLWATTEGGRGMAELMVLLGLSPTDARDRNEMIECLGRAGVDGAKEWSNGRY